MAFIKRVSKDSILVVVLFVILSILSLGSVVAARSAQSAANKATTLIQRSNTNSPVLSIIKDCTDPAGKCYQQNTANTTQLIALVVAQQACVVKESVGYGNLPDRTPAEIQELKDICKRLLGGDALDLLRRVDKFVSSTTTTTTSKP